MENEVVYINFEEGVKRVANNAKMFVKLLSKFKNYQTLQEIEDALAEGDMEKAQAAAHTLKGLAANLSLIELQKQTLELETQIKAKSVNPDQLTMVKDAHAKTLVEVDKVIEQNA